MKVVMPVGPNTQDAVSYFPREPEFSWSRFAPPAVARHCSNANRMRAMRFRRCYRANDAVLHIAAEQNDKGFALPENFGPSHGTGTARVIGKILFHQKRGRVVTLQSQIQTV